MEARLENKHNSRANWCNKNHNRLYRDSMIEFELEFNIAVEIRLKNTHCMPPWGTSYTVAGPLKPPTMTSLPVGTEVAVTTSMEKRTRARVKKEEIFNIIISDEDWISYNADSYSKGKGRREILVECNHLKLIYNSKENEYTWKSPPRAATLETSHIDKLLRRKRTWRPTFLIKELAKSLAVLRRFHTARRQIKPLVQHPYVTRYNFLILSYPWFWDYRQSALAGSMLSWGGRILAGGSSVWGRLG